MALTLRHSLVALVAGVLVTGCSVDKTERPPLGGPSELGTALTLRATPDTLPQDGQSMSQIVIDARDANGQPLRSLSMRADIWVNNVGEDFGELSARTLATGSDGRATVTYTAPAGVDGSTKETNVSIGVTPMGTDAANQVTRFVQIRLVPTGIITPPEIPVPDFTFEPETATQGETVSFNASDPALDNDIASYSWNFGDGSRGSGRFAQHTYDAPGSYAVTLTVTNYRGISGSRAKLVTVDPSDDPTADFVLSPTEPGVGKTVFFDASTSKAAAGRTIVSYAWTLGVGNTASGKVVSTSFGTAGTYTITLTVTDDLGNTGSTSKTVKVE